MDIRTIFGENVRSLRLKLFMSQEALAEVMGVDRAHVSSMERGEQNVTILTVLRVAEALEGRPHDLLDPEFAKATLPKANGKAPRRKRTKVP